MSTLTSIIGIVLIVGTLVLVVWLDYKNTQKAKKELDELDRIANEMYEKCVELANNSPTFEEVEESMRFMDEELHENDSFKYPRRYSDFRACYAYLKGKRAILIKEVKQS